MFDEEVITDGDPSAGARREAVELFRSAYGAQRAGDYEAAVELYRRSIETYPTAEAHTFLGWTYSFQGRYREAIEQCLVAIRVDPTFGNPYNDIGSYLIAQGDAWSCVPWFRRALAAPRYEARAFPHFNLGRVYEERRRHLDAARHYGLALEEQPSFTQAAKGLRRMQRLVNDGAARACVALPRRPEICLAARRPAVLMCAAERQRTAPPLDASAHGPSLLAGGVT